MLAATSWRVRVIANAVVSVPASRAKLTMLNTMSKIRGQVKSPGYPQSEGLLGECMIRYGKELGEDSNFGECPVGRADEAAEAAAKFPSCSSEFWKGFCDRLCHRLVLGAPVSQIPIPGVTCKTTS